MGVFDYVKCEYPVPGMPDIEYQTKDTDEQYLEEYKIDAEGRLWLNKKDRGWVVEKKQVLGGYNKLVSSEWVLQPDFRGDINFYGTDKNGKWWEYSALFKDGILIDMKAVAEGIAR